jgi:hypothetical protein
MSERTRKSLADAIIADLSATYDLIYINQGDQLTDEQVDALVAGDDEKLWDLLSEFELDARDEGLSSVLTDAVKTVIDRWEREDGEDYTDLAAEFEQSEDEEAVREAITERESGDWVKELANGAGDVLLRITALDEDHAYDNEDVTPERALADVGLPGTPGNIEVMADTLAECSPEFSVLMGYWIAGVNVGDLLDLPTEVTHVEIVNPHLYLGNPFAGSGWISEDPFEGVVTVARDQLRTDRQAFGYSVDKIYGGLLPSSFSATIRPAAPSTELASR